VDFSLNEAERELVDLCRDFAQNEIARRAPAAWDEARCPTDLLREMGALGLLGMLVPEQWGGIGMSTVGFVAAMEQIGLADQSVAAAWQAHVTIGSMPLYLFGDDDQRERWLRPLAEGRALGAFGLTEPDAGSDARGIRTRAEPHDGGYVINGRKTFISNAGTDMSFGVTLLARVGTSNEDAPRYASFVVEQGTPGYTMGPKLRGIGWRGLDTRELFFDDVWVPDDHLIGDADLGLSQFLRTLEVGRISIAALSLSLTQAVLDPLAHLPRRVAARRRPALPQRGRHGEAEGEPAGHLGGVRGGADPRWARLHARHPRGPLLLRRQGARDRRGHQRDPAHGHRPRPGLLTAPVHRGPVRRVRPPRAAGRRPRSPAAPGARRARAPARTAAA